MTTHPPLKGSEANVVLSHLRTLIYTPCQNKAGWEAYVGLMERLGPGEDALTAIGYSSSWVMEARRVTGLFLEVPFHWTVLDRDPRGLLCPSGPTTWQHRNRKHWVPLAIAREPWFIETLRTFLSRNIRKTRLRPDSVANLVQDLLEQAFQVLDNHDLGLETIEIRIDTGSDRSGRDPRLYWPRRCMGLVIKDSVLSIGPLRRRRREAFDGGGLVYARVRASKNQRKTLGWRTKKLSPEKDYGKLASVYRARQRFQPGDEGDLTETDRQSLDFVAERFVRNEGLPPGLDTHELCDRIVSYLLYPDRERTSRGALQLTDEIPPLSDGQHWHLAYDYLLDRLTEPGAE